MPVERKRNVIVAIVEQGVVMCTVDQEAEDDTNEHAYDDVVSMMILSLLVSKCARGLEAFDQLEVGAGSERALIGIGYKLTQSMIMPVLMSPAPNKGARTHMVFQKLVW